MWSRFLFPAKSLCATFLMLVFVAGCSKQSPIESTSDTQVTVKVTFDTGEASAVTKSQSLQKIATITTVVVTVTAPDLDPPITANLQMVGKTASGTIRVPQGNARTFTVRGLDEAGIVQFEGQKPINLTGPTATVDITVTKIYPVPSKLRVVGEPQHNLVKLEWDKNDDPDFSRYEIYRSTSTSRPSQPLVTFESKEVTSYSDTTVEELRTYTYWLNTVDTEGYQVAENTNATLPQVAANTPRNPTPQAVVVTKDSESSTKVKLSWTKSEAPDFAFYRVARAEVSGVSYNDVLVDITDRTTTSFVDSTIEKCKSYYYAVYAVGRVSYGDFPSDMSNTITASTEFRDTDFIFYDVGDARFIINAAGFDGGGANDMLLVKFDCKTYPSRIDSIQLTLLGDSTGSSGRFRIIIAPFRGDQSEIQYAGPPMDIRDLVPPGYLIRKNFPITWQSGKGEATRGFFAGLQYLGDGTLPFLLVEVDTTIADTSHSFYFQSSTSSLFGFRNGVNFFIRAHVSSDGCAGGQWLTARPVGFATTETRQKSDRALQPLNRRQNLGEVLRPRKLESLLFR